MINMEDKKFINDVLKVQKKINSIISDYIKSNKIYSENDILKVSFNKYQYHYEYTCKIVNIYSPLQYESLTNIYHPDTNIIYFARYCWKDDNDNLCIGDHCPLGWELSDREVVCGHLGIDYDSLKIEVIKEEDVKRSSESKIKIE